jgi:membrane protease YdiL (CAAX protease family)
LGLLFLRRSLTPGGFKDNAYTPPVVALQESLFLIALLLALIVMLRLEKRPFVLDFLPMSRALGRDFWSGLAWGFGAMTLLLAGMRALHAFYFGSFALRGMQVLKFGSLWGLAFFLVGIFEESFSRGYAQATLSQGIGFWPAALVNSLIFAGIHMTNSGESLLGITSVLCVALFFCLTLWRTGSLWFAVGFHAAWDYAETFIYGVPDSAEVATGHLLNPHFGGSHWITGGKVGPEGSLLVFAVYGLAALLFVLFYAKRPFGVLAGRG